MAKVSASQRKSLPDSAFAYPKQRMYLIHDKNHARLALAMAARKDSFGDVATVRRAVARKFPDLIKKRSPGARA